MAKNLSQTEATLEKYTYKIINEKRLMNDSVRIIRFKITFNQFKLNFYQVFLN